MKVVCILEKNVTDFILEEMYRLSDVDVLIFKYGTVGGIDFSGDSGDGVLYDLALLSGNMDCTLLAGCDTYLCGVKRKSCLVYDKGKLLSVSDGNYPTSTSGYSAGFGYKVFDTSLCSFGVVLGDDVQYPLPAYVISHALGDYVFYLTDSSMESENRNYAKAFSMLGGLDGIYMFSDDVFACTSGGEVDFGGGEGIRLFNLKRSAKYYDAYIKERR